MRYVVPALALIALASPLFSQVGEANIREVFTGETSADDKGKVLIEAIRDQIDLRVRPLESRLARLETAGTTALAAIIAALAAWVGASRGRRPPPS